MATLISELKKQWDREAESYQVQEVGSGVQRFVKQVLKSDIFGLSEGELGTDDFVRKNEFIEEKAKKNKRADVILFINSDIIIPIEVERFGNILAGEKQLFEYQHVWDKKYGLLTDGYEWRFYNNKLCVKTFNLHNIFDETDSFVEFWKEYIQPKNYYLQFFEKLGQLELFVDDVSIGNKIQSFFLDITTLIKSFQHKLGVKGYFETIENKTKAQKLATETTYAYIIQFILYKTLVDNDFSDFRTDFDDRLKRVHQGLKNENYSDILNAIRVISTGISKNIYRPFIREQEIINQTIENLITKATNQLEDVTPWLDIFIFIKRYSFANVKNDIFGYIYENYLKDLYEDEEQRGQYFTDSSIVRFMLEQVGYTANELKNKIKSRQLDKLSIVDPACGSGTFLYSATDEIVKSFSQITDKTSRQIEDIVTSNIFGLDVEAFPLYLAEMNILMRILPLIMGEKYNNPLEKKIKVFWTKDSISEFIGSEPITIGKQISFSDKIIAPKVDSFVRSLEDLTEMKESMHQFPRRRFDFVIGNPPYIGYNECSKQGVLITQLIQNKTVQMSDIYGVNLNTVPGRIKAYAPKPNLYAFFIALGLALLKDNGILCYIIPQTLLTQSDHDVLRYHLSKKTMIKKIITFNGRMFIGRGIRRNKEIPTSSLIIVIKNESPNEENEVEVINYLNKTDGIEDIDTILDNISAGRNITIKNIIQSELLDKVSNWNFIKQDNRTIKFQKDYDKNGTIDIYRLPELSQPKFHSVFYFDKGLVFPKNAIKSFDEVHPNQEYYYLPSVQKGRFRAYVTDNVILKKDIRFPKGSQGIDVYDRKYKVIWKYMNTDKFYFSEDNIMVNFNWIVISSDNKKETEYILSLLNSRTSRLLFNSLLKSESEKDILIGIKVVKEFFRIPLLNTGNNHVKNEVIKRTEEMLSLEDKTVSDFVDFSKVLVQKFDDLKITENALILTTHNDRVIELEIMGDTELIADTITKRFGTQREYEITLSELRNLPVLDYEKQTKLKDNIDDLVFALYFVPQIDASIVHNTTKLKELCSTSKYYKLLI